MSAYVVEAEHINVLLWAGRYAFRRHCGNLTWTYDNPSRVNQLTDHNLNQVGQMLVDANTASVNHCYFDNPIHEPYLYRYTTPLRTDWTVVAVLKALQCYEYQSSDPKDWESSQAHAFCRELQNLLIQALPGYDRSPWAITRTARPQFA
ncbi:hypothetical protein MAHJHV58_31790 [Mycobacterium avium subsp. hominissuis]|uniref:hypothetical protein n=2 Tax=Mycobacterium avium TaxID=1764 RepID=UPI0004507547|nr:hypothetical protein [Mycobacterium avium]ETZ55267.1 hypothetical protein L838_0923 [Mycobacterium avium MAV_120709_2344]